MKTRKPPRELLKKSHAHKSKRDYKRADKNTWQDELNANPPHLKIIEKEKEK